jgi:hypothetical protein
MDTLRVDVVWRSNDPGDIRNAADILREMADRLEASILSKTSLEVFEKTGRVGVARIIRDRR